MKQEAVQIFAYIHAYKDNNVAAHTYMHMQVCVFVVFLILQRLYASAGMAAKIWPQAPIPICMKM